MENQPIQDPSLLEAIEACRPGSDDVSHPALAFLASRLANDPELAGVYERTQRVDAVVAEAFHDAPVPEGLADRIMERLAAARRGEIATAGASPAAEPAAAQPTAPVATRRRRVSGRWLLAGAGSLAVVASVLVAVFFPRPEPVAYTGSQVAEMAIDFFDRDWGEPGQLVAAVPAPEAYPFSPAVREFPEMRWRGIGDFLGREGVAYDMSLPDGTRATLYVVHCAVAGLPDVPPPRPLLNSRQRSTSAWRSGELLYVLVVDGGPRTYRAFLPPPGLVT